jgi:hypothetical protein
VPSDVIRVLISVVSVLLMLLLFPIFHWKETLNWFAVCLLFVMQSRLFRFLQDLQQLAVVMVAYKILNARRIDSTVTKRIHFYKETHSISTLYTS